MNYEGAPLRALFGPADELRGSTFSCFVTFSDRSEAVVPHPVAPRPLIRDRVPRRLVWIQHPVVEVDLVLVLPEERVLRGTTKASGKIPALFLVSRRVSTVFFS